MGLKPTTKSRHQQEPNRRSIAAIERWAKWHAEGYNPCATPQAVG